MATSGKPLAFFSLRLCLALLASMLLHLLIVAGSVGWLPQWKLSASVPLEVTLVKTPPPITPGLIVRRPKLKPVPKTVPASQVAAHSSEKSVQPESIIKKEEVTTEPVIPESQLALPQEQQHGSEAQEAETITRQEAQEPLPELVQEPVQDAAPEAAPEPLRPPPPRHVEMIFLVNYDGVNAVETQRYQVFADGRYELSSTAEATGLPSLVLSDLNQKSTGHVTPQGLKPETFTYQYGSNNKKAQKASFDWVSKNLTMEVGEKKQTVPLVEGTQDLLSFLYQFMFTPPLEQFQLAVTTGKKLKTYAYLFEGEEDIDTRLGVVRALHIAKSSGSGEEKAELWLAENYYYLPVKIRKTDSDGKVIESTINSINITP